MEGFGRMSELATALAAQTDVEGVARTVGDAMRGAVSFSVAGIVLNAWGDDRVDLLRVAGVAQDDVDTVLGIVAGRDVGAEPFATVRSVQSGEEQAATHGEWAISAVELTYGDLEIGWLFAARRDGGHYDAQDRALLEGVAAHTAAALGRAALFSRVRDDYAATVAALSAALDTGERRPVAAHAGRMMEDAVAIGEQMGLERDQIEQLRFAGLLHDSGATGVAREVVVRPAAIDPRRAPAHGPRGAAAPTLVEQIDFVTALTPVILHHHEHWDGSGYPHALAGETIPLLARVLAVADAFDTLTAKASTDLALTSREARATIEQGAGTLYDPRVTAALGRVLDAQAAAGMTGLLGTVSTQDQPQLLS